MPTAATTAKTGAPATAPAAIFRVLALSTSHLPKHLGLAGLDEVTWVCADAIEGGWFVYAPDDPDSWDVPAEVRELFRYARNHNCRYIHLHCDNGQVPDLPTWEW